ncbi:MAG: sigma 54-interacting transcriptional regulator [Deltaproteobacteria bacterium]|jgi:formate hydrogenlyase transcriptional activator|nr:sigma 54-interacting transcriptional regulator [Deltaproteobacteria bacterium]MBT4003449.1 sigma 54-interacting transcriptional regulator [Chloroflexota bacterium]MBT4269503.1 sigma 54-interacting transcriptional regulator [Deltaproteobacteria bacterium]MBT4642958.1 sigma 54-interacting transcriptional regulator [Deltaproteobacteria bacterium]MBT6504732.1 sigma 54-interacting transcriptional regulator [Deltaproteobacteria bacterium]
MTVNEKEFFQQMTLCICGSLEIDAVLNESFSYIKNYIPADQIFLSYSDPRENAIVLMASASEEGGDLHDSKAVISREEQKILADLNQFPEFLLLNHIGKQSIASYVLELLGKPDSSMMFCRLRIDGQYMGSIGLRANGKNRFTKYHLHLLSLLKEPWAIALSNSRRFLELLELKELLADENQYLHRELQYLSSDQIIGAEKGLKKTIGLAKQVSVLNSPVLLLGETGVGKEIIAGAIHKWSNQKNDVFIKVNCGAIPDTLIDSELFGHEKGAFTGANSTVKGRFERANGGTIFLDEIAELPLNAQVRLLRVLQDKVIERVGGSTHIELDIRILSATHRNLEDMVKKGQFREDLWYRLNVFPIHIPPLRYRKIDIKDLANHFLHKKSIDMGRTSLTNLSEYSIKNLVAYDWPGNVRELENTIERALILNNEGQLNIGPIGQASTMAPSIDTNIESEESLDLDLAMKLHIKKVLKKADGIIEGKNGAARLMGIKPSTLRHRMKKLGIIYGRQATRKAST